MDTTGLYDRFRGRIKDTKAPYFWTEDEVFEYMDLAYRKFVRLIGGISDFTSEATQVDIIAGEASGVLHPSVLRVLTAQRQSDNGDITIINYTDLTLPNVGDYGKVTSMRLDNTVGVVHKGVIGMQKGLVRWIYVPVADDTALLTIKRLPLNRLTDFDQEISEVEEDHHLALIDGMFAEALLKQDADTFDLGKSENFEAKFRAYADSVRAELERYEFKPRVVQYGGL